MTRTRTRPVPSGKIGAQEALEFGATLAAFSVFAMAFLVGYVAGDPARRHDRAFTSSSTRCG